MGCVPYVSQERSNWGEPHLIVKGRNVHTAEGLSCHTKKINIEYACLSVSGLYPNAPNRSNQDQFCFFECFGGDPDLVFFAVFDGHGCLGTQCAQFCRDHVPIELSKELAKFRRDPSAALRRSIIKTNDNLRKEKQLCAESSGTTCIAVLIRASTAYIANVGDSRAIASIKGEKDNFLATPLSRDQTPYREDERARVLKAGARIMTSGQAEGEVDMDHIVGWLNAGTELDMSGDPPRVYLPNQKIPGCAFTRSLGDFAVEKVGVVAEAEIEVIEIDQSYACICAASDGIFEFLTNQDVVDIIHSSDYPLDGCTRLIRESQEHWMLHEARADDMTIIVIMLGCIGPEESLDGKSNQSKLLEIQPAVSISVERTLFEEKMPTRSSSFSQTIQDTAVAISGSQSENFGSDMQNNRRMTLSESQSGNSGSEIHKNRRMTLSESQLGNSGSEIQKNRRMTLSEPPSRNFESETQKNWRMTLSESPFSKRNSRWRSFLHRSPVEKINIEIQHDDNVEILERKNSSDLGSP